MAIEPIASGETPSADADTTGNPVAGESFRERKFAALQAESDPVPGTPDAPGQRGNAESAEDGYPNDGPSDPYHPDEDTLSVSRDAASDDQDTDADGALFDDESEATPEDQPEGADEDTPDYNQLQQRYDNLEKKFREVTANRQQIETEMTATAERNVSLSHELEEHSNAAVVRAKLFMDLANNQVNQFENINWDAIEPENMAAAKQQYQQAVVNRNAMTKAFEEAEKADKDARERIRQKEAEYSRSILPIKIPGWSNEIYGQMRDYAMDRYGWTAAEFNDKTDYRDLLPIHEAMQASQATEKVTKVQRERKARRPRNRNARPQSRNAEGQFQSARDRAFNEPGNKAAYREYKRQQLEREQGTRR